MKLKIATCVVQVQVGWTATTSQTHHQHNIYALSVKQSNPSVMRDTKLQYPKTCLLLLGNR